MQPMFRIYPRSVKGVTFRLESGKIFLQDRVNQRPNIPGRAVLVSSGNVLFSRMILCCSSLISCSNCWYLESDIKPLGRVRNLMRSRNCISFSSNLGAKVLPVWFQANLEKAKFDIFFSSCYFLCSYAIPTASCNPSTCFFFPNNLTKKCLTANSYMLRRKQCCIF